MTIEPCVAIDVAQLTTNFDRRYVLCIQKLYHRPHFTVGGCWNKSLHLQPLQRCYSQNSGSPASAFVMRHHYSITYTRSFHIINGLRAVGQVGNLLFGRPSYNVWKYLRVFENKVVRKIFESKKDETAGKWRKLHNAELDAFYSPPNIIRNLKSRRLRWAGYGTIGNAYRVLVERPEGGRYVDGRIILKWI